MYQYPDYGQAEYLYHETIEDLERGSVRLGGLEMMVLAEREATMSLGTSILLGNATITRFRIRTRCGQARLIVTVNRPNGSLIHAFDVLDLNRNLTDDVAFDQADMDTHFASIGIAKES